MVTSIDEGSVTRKKKQPQISQQLVESRQLEDNLAIAAAATHTQTNMRKRRERGGDSLVHPEARPPPISIAGETMMKSAELQLMTPLLHFLQLLCENHNFNLQVRASWGGRGGEMKGEKGRGVREKEEKGRGRDGRKI